ncbi:hypothetical protein PVAND_002607 [Polypedilum vanderplanki]|uniref:F-box domain-containing protein n=1 Tax=Polypedilum vanderplanki TaxID=319348 RepID=A0A9J6BS01_POLVA|nr:hypothetical protein PVAND_002607 [Polypedilum vanderplanki]
MSDEIFEIFCLPDEILMNIIGFIVNSNNLALSCKRFYQLVCYSTRNSIPLELTCADIDDEDIFKSVMNSSRQFIDLTINLKYSAVLENSTYEKIISILKKYGDSLEIFKIWSSIQSKPVEMNESQLYNIFSHIPNTYDCTLRNIVITQNDEIYKEKELNLYKMKKLVLDYCMINSASIFNKIPSNVIHDLVFTFEPYDERNFQEFFYRQSKIVKLELYENDKINFAHLQLEHIKISSNIDYKVMIEQQPNLQYIDFAIAWVNEVTFVEVCKLKNLQVLKTLIDLISCKTFKHLQNLISLKELRLDSHSSHDMGYLQELSMMRGMQLEKLTLLLNERKISPEVILQFANNFHYLKQIELINRSINIIVTIIQNLPNLETILLDFFAVFGAPDDILTLEISDESNKFPNIKQLIVTNVNVNEEENGRNLLKLVSLCPNIQKLMLSKIIKFSNEELRSILMSHANLSHFSLETDDTEFGGETVEMIFEYGKNLKHFRLAGIKNCLPYKVLKEIFSEKFPILNTYKYCTGDIEVVMKKKRIKDWYLEFKLMDHF